MLFRSIQLASFLVVFILWSEQITAQPQSLCAETNPSALIASSVSSFAYGRGITGGITNAPVTTIIQLVDFAGLYITSGGDDVNVGVLGPATNPQWLRVLSTDNDDGTYTFTYQAAEEGEYAVYATVNGNAITGSPFLTNFVSSSNCSLPGTEASGPFLDDAYAEVFCVTTVILTSF